MIQIKEELCIGCGACVKDCVAHNIILKEGKAVPKRDCFLCGHCVAVCPKNAVSIPEYDMDEVEDFDTKTVSLDPDRLLLAIKARRSIRDYEERPVETEKLKLLAQAGRYTATAKNNQDCHFVFIQKELPILKDLVWGYIEKETGVPPQKLPKDLVPYASFLRHHKADPADDFLFRNAPAVLYITSDWPLDAGLAAQNMELMADALGLGVLYNGFLARISDVNEELKAWLGIEGQPIRACMLLGYPKVSYRRTAPRRKANVILR